MNPKFVFTKSRLKDLHSFLKVMLKDNHLGFPVSMPPLQVPEFKILRELEITSALCQVEYSAPASGCSLEPVPSDLVSVLDVTG